MTDELDIASELEQIARDAAITAYSNKPSAAVATGVCLECSAVLANGARWCDYECRDSWQRWNPEA